MKKYLSVLLALGALIGLGGCAQPLPTIASVDPNNLTDQQSVLVVSAGAAETCVSFSTAFVIKESSQPAVMSKSIGVYQLNNSFVKSDFEGEYGKVYSTVLQPGEYDLWLYAQNPYTKIYDPILTRPFTLEAGKVTYIGEIYSVGCNSVDVSVRDRSERDLKQIKLQQPNLELSNVVINPAKLAYKPQKSAG